MCDCALNAGKIKVPVLIFEGGDDHITVPSEVRGIYDNLRSAKRMIVVDGAGHLESYERAQALYEKESRNSSSHVSSDLSKSVVCSIITVDKQKYRGAAYSG